MRSTTRGRAAAAIVAGALWAAVGGAAPASAHVTVYPRAATQGGFAKLGFRVPNERADASTVKVEVVIPAQTVIASVAVRPTPGWTVTVQRTTLSTPVEVHGSDVTDVVSRIIWSAAAGGGVQPGHFQEFEISAGPLPEVDRIVFKALQTYSTGEIVRWIEEPPAGGGEEPEHPAPVLDLISEGGADGGGADGGAAAPAITDQAAATDQAGAASAGGGAAIGWALAAGLAGLVAGLAGLVLGLLAWRRTGAPPPLTAGTEAG